MVHELWTISEGARGRVEKESGSQDLVVQRLRICQQALEPVRPSAHAPQEWPLQSEAPALQLECSARAL